MFNNKIYLKNNEEVADNTVKLVFDKPVNFDFIAGQYVMLGVKKGDVTLTRAMTIASAPYQDSLEFVMRITDSDFKQVVSSMKEGDKAYIGNAMGSLVLDEKIESLVFLAGGIGVTPFLSMLKQAENNKSRQQFALFYSNQREEDIVGLDEVKNLSLTSFKLVLTLTKKISSVWLGESGRINKAMLIKYLPKLSAHTYYIVGTSSFVIDMKNLLEKSNVSENQIKVESFPGYKNARTS